MVGLWNRILIGVTDEKRRKRRKEMGKKEEDKENDVKKVIENCTSLY